MSRVLLLLVFTLAARAADVTADSARGERLFETLACIQCHSINGKGGTLAPDLGHRVDRNFTPASLAATMWNHAPTMWSAMKDSGVKPAGLTSQAAADLFAYFYSARFFERPGDAGRGKKLFSSKHCSECHGLTEPKFADAKPVSQWESIGHSIALVDAMWNHAASMREEFARRKLAWPELTAQELADMLVYLRNLPGERAAPGFDITSGRAGAALFESKGCAGCHTGKLDLTSRLKNQTLTGIAVEMWNHAPRMASNPSQLSVEEMRDLLSYLWAGNFFEDSGRAVAGQRVFLSKHCGDCHHDTPGGAPNLIGTGQSFTAATMVSALWRHGPGMLDQIQKQGKDWPHFDAQKMSDLIAYLDSKNGIK